MLIFEGVPESSKGVKFSSLGLVLVIKGQILEDSGKGM